MAKMNKSEEATKGLVAAKLSAIDGHPSSQNIKVNGITWFKEDSYKGTDYDWLSAIFSKASKKQTLKSKGTPDYIIVKEQSNVIIVIECKGNVTNHTNLLDVKEYKTHGYGSADETENYAVNGALWYASFLSDSYDVVAIGISGQLFQECKVTSFVWPKGGNIIDIELLEDTYLDNASLSIEQYENSIEVALNRYAQTEEAIRKTLRRYTLGCANFLRQNGIEDNSKAGFVSAIILGLTNTGSKLYIDTKNAIEKKYASKAKKMLSDPIGKNAVKLLKDSLYGAGNVYEADYIRGIWDIDDIPYGKRTALIKFYNRLLSKDELVQAPKGKNKLFSDGDTVLSCCIYSLYENVIAIIENYRGIDVMGEFYTTFLRFTKGNAKEKGIVLTPKHITELFCDIAEFYSDCKFNEHTKIIDICCGTGAFLITSLARIKKNISVERISEEEKNKKYKMARENSLIGVERDASMYALAYANMRFHGDGKSNLFNCSSLLIDSYAPVDDSGKTYVEDKKIPLHEALKSFGDIDIGMINPPYSLNKKDDSSTQEYAIVQEINEYYDRNKKLKKKIKEIRNKNGNIEDIKNQTSAINKEIKSNIARIQELEDEFTKSGMREVVIQKGQDELDFIASMLHYIKIGGIGIAIVPMSCAGNSGSKLRAELLKYHTLLACMTMPTQLFFDSHVGAVTCIMVFKAHIPHDDNKSVFFGRWIEDGYKVIPHNGRKDTGVWNAIRKEWIGQIDGMSKPNDTIWLRKRIKPTDEALPEAYIKTDYSKLTDSDFESTLKKYALYKYMDENGMLEE
ncbi:MAG: SAM-dependent methyltransferase [Lachnoclostridium sp.]|nr:SAM-dependent methyltransferase [Lachnoclostridium sp.]